MDKILQSPDDLCIELIFREFMNERFSKRIIFLKQFIRYLESDILLRLRQSNSKREAGNLAEAQRVIKKIIEEKNVTASGKKKNV